MVLIMKNKINLNDLKEIFKSETDPMGSYTGVCDEDETPVQDADDL